MSPEYQLVIDKYLQYKDVEKVASMLNMEKDKILKILEKPIVKRHMDRSFLQSGFANKYILQATLDKAIQQKLDEAEESQVYSKKDLADLIELSHKMRVNEEKLSIERLKLEQSLELAKAKILQTEILTGKKLSAADERFKLKLEHDRKLREKETNAYTDLLKRLLDVDAKKEVVAVGYRVTNDSIEQQ